MPVAAGVRRFYTLAARREFSLELAIRARTLSMKLAMLS
jgi:hypothetical protein